MGTLQETEGDAVRDDRAVKVSIFQRLERHIGRRMLAGFIVMVPLAVTYIVLRLVIINIDSAFRPLARGTLLDFPGIGFVFVVVVLYIVGVLVAGRFGRRALGWQHAVLTRIPVVRSIYGVARQATAALSSPADQRFSRVVFIEWPRSGLWAMGFVTGHYKSGDAEAREKVVVYIPTVPNPTSGNLAFVEAEQVVDADMSVEDAMKVVFSGGIVLPETRGVSALHRPPDPRQ